MNKHLIFAFLFVGIFACTAHAQGVAINEDGAQPNESALLDININNAGQKRGILIPRMTANERNLIRQVNGLLVYVTDDNNFYYSDGKNWKRLASDIQPITSGAATNKITNTGGDTKIEIQQTNAGDQMSFSIKGKEIWRHDGKTLNTHSYASDGTESYNILIGDKAGQQLTTGTGNTMVGIETGQFTLQGNYNTFLGKLAGYANQGSGNTFLGYGSGQQNTSGILNVFVGHGAGRNNRTGQSNVFIGNYAANENTTGAQNVFVGHDAGAKNTEGDSNVFIGQYTGSANTTGKNNVFLGQNAGLNNISGVANTYIGQGAGEKSIGTNNVFIGYNAGKHEVGSNKLYISNKEGLGALVYGDFQDSFVIINGRLNVRDVLKLPTRSDAPANPKIGDIYMDSSDPNTTKMRVFTKINGKEQWKDLY